MATDQKTPEPEPDFMAALRRNYGIRDPEAVKRFLQKEPHLLPVLEEAPAEIRKVFPEEA